MLGSRYQGGVFSVRLANGRCGAQLLLVERGIEAESPDGERFQIAWEELHCEIGGASGRMVFCRNADRSLTLFSEDPEFAQDLVAAAPPVAASHVQEVFGAASAGRRRGCGCWLIVLVLCGIGVFLTPTCLRGMASAAVDAVPISVDEKIGKMGWSSMETELPRLDDAVVQEAIDIMLARLVAVVPAEDGHEWDFRVALIRSEQINAFALPGGQMAFFSRLIAEAESADEVAGVLAHEMGHVIRRHGVKRIVQSIGVIAVVQFLVGDYGGLIALGSQMLTMASINAYSRDHENEADAVSVELMHKAGLDPTAMTSFFQRLEEEGEELPAYLSWVSTHPSHQDRIAEVRRLAAGMPPVERRPLGIDWAAVKASLARIHPPDEDGGRAVDPDAGDESNETGSSRPEPKEVE